MGTELDTQDFTTCPICHYKLLWSSPYTDPRNPPRHILRHFNEDTVGLEGELLCPCGVRFDWNAPWPPILLHLLSHGQAMGDHIRGMKVLSALLKT